MLKLLHTEKIKIKKYIQEIFNDMPQAKHALIVNIFNFYKLQSIRSYSNLLNHLRYKKTN